MLSPTERVVIALLRHDSPVSTSDIIDTLYGKRLDGGPEWATTVVRVVIRNARSKLAQLGVEIETVGAGRAFVGRRVKPEHRERLDAILAHP